MHIFIAPSLPFQGDQAADAHAARAPPPLWSIVPCVSRGDDRALEVELEMQGHPNLFKSTPVVISKEWDLLQTLHEHTLLYTQVRTGSRDRWENGICGDVESLRELQYKLPKVSGSICVEKMLVDVLTSWVRGLTGGIQGPRSQLRP